MTMLCGCVASGASKLTPVALPAPPTCMTPVPVSAISAGEDARLALARSQSSLIDANGRLACSRDWYKVVRQEYSKK